MARTFCGLVAGTTWVSGGGAIQLPEIDARSVHQYAMRVLAVGRKVRAMRVFEANRRLHPADKFWPYVGLARGYTALGDRKAGAARGQ